MARTISPLCVAPLKAYQRRRLSEGRTQQPARPPPGAVHPGLPRLSRVPAGQEPPETVPATAAVCPPWPGRHQTAWALLCMRELIWSCLKPSGTFPTELLHCFQQYLRLCLLQCVRWYSADRLALESWQTRGTSASLLSARDQEACRARKFCQASRRCAFEEMRSIAKARMDLVRSACCLHSFQGVLGNVKVSEPFEVWRHMHVEVDQGDRKGMGARTFEEV